MLHILLLVLKWIGIIIAAILGILVLLLCIVLFVPVRYEIQGKCGGSLDTLKGKIKVTWLLHLFCADVYYKEKILKWRIRFAFFKKTSGIRASGEMPTEDKGGESHEKLEKITETPKEEPVVQKAEETPSAESVPKKQKEDKKTAEKVTEKVTGKAGKKESLYEKIKCTFQKFCDKIRELKAKKDRLIEFIEDEIHKNAFNRVKKEFFWYLGKLKPKKMEAQIRYGFEDPSTTGQVLAVLGVLYPFFGEYTEIIPDFEQKILKGRLYVKGRIRLSHLVHLAWKLFWDKNIRKSYKDIKNFKL